MSKRIAFISGPFRAASTWQQELNIRRAEEVALEVWRLGAAVLCPHSNSGHFEGAMPDDEFLDGYLAMLERMDAIVLLPRWSESEGSQREFRHAQTHGIPIFHWPAERAAFILWLRGDGGDKEA